MYKKIFMRIALVVGCMNFVGVLGASAATVDGRVWLKSGYKNAFSDIWLLANMKEVITCDDYLNKIHEQIMAKKEFRCKTENGDWIPSHFRGRDFSLLPSILEKEVAKLAYISRDVLLKRSADREAYYAGILERKYPSLDVSEKTLDKITREAVSDFPSLEKAKKHRCYMPTIGYKMCCFRALCIKYHYERERSKHRKEIIDKVHPVSASTGKDQAIPPTELDKLMALRQSFFPMGARELKMGSTVTLDAHEIWA